MSAKFDLVSAAKTAKNPQTTGKNFFRQFLHYIIYYVNDVVEQK